MRLRPSLTLTDYRRLWWGNAISNLGDTRSTCGPTDPSPGANDAS